MFEIPEHIVNVIEQLNNQLNPEELINVHLLNTIDPLNDDLNSGEFLDGQTDPHTQLHRNVAAEIERGEMLRYGLCPLDQMNSAFGVGLHPHP